MEWYSYHSCSWLNADHFIQAFAQITDLTDVQEGTIVRAITRLDDTCREVRDAARVIGDGALYQKMEACQNLIKVRPKALTV